MQAKPMPILQVQFQLNNSNSPSGAKVRVDVGESGTILSEVAVERRGEALEGDAEVFVETLEHRDREGALVLSPLSREGVAKVGLITLQETPHSIHEVVKLAVVGAPVSVQLLLKNLFLRISDVISSDK